MILSIDPGPERSAWLLLNEDGKPIQFGKIPNDELRTWLRSCVGIPLVIEMIACFGMPVGREVFQTCVHIGRFMEVAGGTAHLMERMEVKKHLCQSARANDATIRQALIDRFGPGKDAAIGRKATPGPLYGITADCWSALALAVTYSDLHPAPTQPAPVGRLQRA